MVQSFSITMRYITVNFVSVIVLLNKYLLSVIFSLVFICLLSPAYAQVELLRTSIDKILRYEAPVDFNIVPGIAIGVIDIDSIYRLTFGRDIQLDGIYEMGSITKPVIAWLVNQALDSLRLSDTASVCTFLPDSLCTPSFRKIRIMDIMQHRTGLARLAPMMGEIESSVLDPYRDYSLNILAHDLLQMEPIKGKYNYSHLNYAMTYWLFELVGGLPAYSKEKLKIPFSLGNTKWETNREEIAQGFGLDGRPQPPWNTNALSPAMGLKSSLDDQLKLMQAFIDEYKEDPNIHYSKALKKEIKALEKTGAYKVFEGWFLIRLRKSIVLYHNGRTGGHHASIAFIPEMKKGVIVISNGAVGSNDLSLLILRMIQQSKPAKVKN